MCGIVAYDGQSEALSTVVAGMKNLEYRGYNSAGIALQENGRIDFYKQAGEIDHLELPESSPARSAIGYTRWNF